MIVISTPGLTSFSNAENYFISLIFRMLYCLMSYPNILFWVKGLTIIYFYSNIFLDTLSHSVHVKIFDPSSDSSSQLLLVLMFRNMVTESKKNVHFKYIMKSMLFYHMWMYSLLCFNLPEDLVQTLVSHCFDLSAMAYYSHEHFTCVPALFLKSSIFCHPWYLLTLCWKMSKKLRSLLSEIRNGCDALLLRFSKNVERHKILEIRPPLWLWEPYGPDVLMHVIEEEITLRRSMLCSSYRWPKATLLVLY